MPCYSSIHVSKGGGWRLLDAQLGRRTLTWRLENDGSFCRSARFLLTFAGRKELLGGGSGLLRQRGAFSFSALGGRQVLRRGLRKVAVM
jgi:hypothetical protein